MYAGGLHGGVVYPQKSQSKKEKKLRKKKGEKSRKVTKITVKLFTNESKVMSF